MNEGMNRVTLLGNLGADPELRYTASGVPLLSMRLATNESFLDRNREVQERTEWHSVVVWGARAEALGRLLSKGECVLVEGALRTTSYEKDGVKRWRTEVMAREVRFTGRRHPPAPPEEVPPPDAGGAAGGLGVPAMLGVPGMPGMPGMPGVPRMPGEPGEPGVEELPRAQEGRRAGRKGAGSRASPPPLMEEMPY
ncbi:single-stranded DNA-binding protein [Chondromyces apiculatus]|nr:single-stranded DNA-binding protein [Chondromyces apiculatus]